MLGLCGVTVTILNMAVLPLLGILPSELGASADGVSWVSTSILLAGAVANPVLGRLGDLFGKRRVLLASLGACAIGSALSAVAGSLGPMLVGRTLQGFAMGLIPLGISIARDELPPHRVAGGIALVSATIGIGSGLGLPSPAS